MFLSTWRCLQYRKQNVFHGQVWETWTGTLWISKGMTVEEDSKHSLNLLKQQISPHLEHLLTFPGCTATLWQRNPHPISKGMLPTGLKQLVPCSQLRQTMTTSESNPKACVMLPLFTAEFWQILQVRKVWTVYVGTQSKDFQPRLKFQNWYQWAEDRRGSFGKANSYIPRQSCKLEVQTIH